MVATTTAELTADPDTPDATAVRPSRRHFRFIANKKAAVGLIIAVCYVILAIVGPWVSPYDPSGRSSDILQGPSAQHWFGTTHLGQDIFSQVLTGARSVLEVGFLAGVIATVLSVLIGVTAGYISGWGAETLSSLSNIFLVIPALPLIIIITSTLPNAGDATVAIIIGCTSWAWGARILRAQTLSLRRRDYVEAARASGEYGWRIVTFELLPNLTAVIATNFVGTVIFAVTSEITLAFIGVSGTAAWNWGTILFWAQSQLALELGAWWWFIPAGLAIALLGTALALLNFGIDEFVNPRLRDSGGRRIKTRHGSKRMRVGFTPVVRDSDLLPSAAAETPAPAPVVLGADQISFGGKGGDR